MHLANSPIKLVGILDLEFPNIRAYAIMHGINETDMLLDTSIVSWSISACPCKLTSCSSDFLSVRYLEEEIVGLSSQLQVTEEMRSVHYASLSAFLNKLFRHILALAPNHLDLQR
jgi:hypothetical protein